MVSSRHERISEPLIVRHSQRATLTWQRSFYVVAGIGKGVRSRIPNYSLSFGVSAVEDFLRSALEFELRNYIHYSGTTKTKCNNAETPRLNTRPVHYLLLRSEANHLPLLHDIQALLQRVL